jgi:hypothetical protein
METTETINTLTSISAAFPVKLLAEFKSVELEQGQYLVRKIEKGTGKESKGVVIPEATGEEFLIALENEQILSGAIRWYQETRAEVCKTLIAAGASSIVAGDYADSEIVSYLQAQEVTEGRISKERLASWFDANLSPVLFRAVGEKFPELDSDKKTEVVGAYRGIMVQLAKKDLSLAEDVIAKMKKAFSLLPETLSANPIVRYCEEKLAGATPKVADMLGL